MNLLPQIGGETKPRRGSNSAKVAEPLSHTARPEPGLLTPGPAHLRPPRDASPFSGPPCSQDRGPWGRTRPVPSDGDCDHVFPPLKESLHWIVPSPLSSGRWRGHVYMYILSASVQLPPSRFHRTGPGRRKAMPKWAHPTPIVPHPSLPAWPLARCVFPTPKTQGASRQKAGVGFALF